MWKSRRSGALKNRRYMRVSFPYKRVKTAPRFPARMGRRCTMQRSLTMILSCSNVTKSFGDKHILKQVSFHLEDHEKAAIVGINGAGKTTLDVYKRQA